MTSKAGIFRKRANLRSLVFCFSIIFFLTIYADADGWCFWCATKMTKTDIVKALQSQGNEEKKLISYSTRDFRKRNSTKVYEADNDGASAKVRSWMKNQLSGQEIEAVFVAKINLGVDLKKFTENNVSLTDGNNITILLPKIEVISVELDMSNLMVKERSGLNVSNSQRTDFLRELFARHKSDIKTGYTSDEANIEHIVRAKKNVKQILKELISNGVGKDFELTFNSL